MKKIVFFFAILAVLAGCSLNQEPPALEALNFLKGQNFSGLAELACPNGIRFSPYAFVNTENDVVLSPVEIADLTTDTNVRAWGFYDGSGAPIKLTFAEYAKRFVYDHDFVNAPQSSNEKILGQGNTINNVSDIYPGAKIYEYYFPGFDPELDGMDWASLRLIFQQEGGNWCLTGVAHDEWTI